MVVVVESERPRLCPYCGSVPKGNAKGEHVIQAALGGAFTIKDVCQSCNNSFSAVDNELSSRSPLAVIASQELKNGVYQIWDVDHSSENLLLEATPDWEAKAARVFPQVIFERDGPRLSGDVGEMYHVGSAQFSEILMQSARRAYFRHGAETRTSINLDRVDVDSELLSTYRLPPRLYFRKSIFELAERLRKPKHASGILRYLTDRDLRFAFHSLANWSMPRRWRSERVLGSRFRLARSFWDTSKVLRALLKMAVNVLYAYCPRTPLNHDTLSHVIRLIKGDLPIRRNHLAINGFIHARDAIPVACPAGHHAFRIAYSRGLWSICGSYFGGRIATLVSFPGPNQEDWEVADIIAPIGKRDWTFLPRCGILSIPLNCRIEWLDPNIIMPTVEMFNVRSEIRVIGARHNPASSA
jgi:hypothetical protein